jgi:hypothetical protein
VKEQDSISTAQLARVKETLIRIYGISQLSMLKNQGRQTSLNQKELIPRLISINFLDQIMKENIFHGQKEKL